MNSAAMFLIILGCAIALLMLLIMKAKVHPLLAIFAVAMLTGLALGYGFPGTLEAVNVGFGSTLQGVGITIILGSTIAMAIQDTGAAKAMVNFFIKLFRGKNLELAPALTAFIVSIPVFGDITTILTAPIASILATRKKISMSTMTSFTQLGLNLTHALVPPTPGILAIAIMFNADLGLTIFWGIIISLIAFLGCWLILKKWTEKEWIEPRADFVEGIEEAASDKVEDIVINSEGSPNTLLSFMPVALPVLLIAIGSFVKVYLPEESMVRGVFVILGDKVVSLSIAVLFNIFLGYKQRQTVLKNHHMLHPGDKDLTIGETVLNRWVARGITVALLPLLITAMGGALSNVIKTAPAIQELSAFIVASPVLPILVPFAIGAILMTAVGSMTTAGMTAAGIVLPMIGGLGISPIAAVLAIGSGTMIFNHVNNSGFWTISQFFNLNLKQAIKYITIPDALGGIICITMITIFSALGIF